MTRASDRKLTEIVYWTLASDFTPVNDFLLFQEKNISSSFINDDDVDGDGGNDDDGDDVLESNWSMAQSCCCCKQASRIFNNVELLKCWLTKKTFLQYCCIEWLDISSKYFASFYTNSLNEWLMASMSDFKTFPERYAFLIQACNESRAFEGSSFSYSRGQIQMTAFTRNAQNKINLIQLTRVLFIPVKLYFVIYLFERKSTSL